MRVGRSGRQAQNRMCESLRWVGVSASRSSPVGLTPRAVVFSSKSAGRVERGDCRTSRDSTLVICSPFEPPEGVGPPDDDFLSSH